MSLSREIYSIYSEDIWDVPKTWGWVHMSAISKVVGGGTPKSSVSEYFGNDIPWITPADMSSHEGVYIKTGSRSLSLLGYENSSAQRLPKNTVLFSSRAPIGYVAIAANELCTNQGFKSFVPETDISPKFLYYWLSSAKRLAEKIASGTTFLEISAKNAGLLPIPLAPPQEQTRIVEKLEELLSDLDNGVEELKAAQLKLTQYRQSLLKSAVEGSLTEVWRQQNTPKETGTELLERILKERRERWEEQKLAEFKTKGKNPPKNWKEKYPEPVQPDTNKLPELPEGWVWATIDQLALNKRYGSSSKTNDDSSGIPVLRMGNIQDGEIDYDSLKHLPKNHSEFPHLLLSDGDLLFNRTNSAELVGKTAVYRDIGKPCSYASYLISVTFSESFLPEIAAYFINSTLGKAWLASVMNQTAGQANVNGTKLGALAVPLAPFDEQKHLISEMHNLRDDLESQSTAVQLGLKQSEAQRKNILKDAFSGKLVPQNPSDQPASTLLERIKQERELLSQQPKHKTSKKKKTMKKPDSSLLVRDWIVKQSAPFTFEQLSSAVDIEYETLQGELFKLLSAPSPIVTQAFDKGREYIVFKVTES